MAKIYTKTGDAGQTGLIGGDRVSKADLRVAAYGDVDELNSFLGWARAAGLQAETEAQLAREQDTLFRLGAYLADPQAAADERRFDRQTTDLEKAIDALTALLPVLESFILPAGSEPVARLHLARAVCRRAERSLVVLNESDGLDQSALIYANRLSDYLFVAARAEGAGRDEPETAWKP